MSLSRASFARGETLIIAISLTSVGKEAELRTAHSDGFFFGEGRREGVWYS